MEKHFDAVIFDLDGTVLDNEDVYGQAFLVVLKKYGIDGRNEEFAHARGIGLEKNWEHLKGTYTQLAGIDITQLVHETQDAYHSMFDQVSVRDGFRELRQMLTEEGVSLSLATSNNWWIVEDELEELKLHEMFDSITTGEEVAQKKPAPDIFLVAAKKMDIEPGRCVVVEDSPAGVTAAKEAGMKVIAVMNKMTNREAISKADLIVEGFEDLTPQVLEDLFLN